MIIAELCQNHGGDASTLEEMVRQAGAAGATFAKIQSFFAEDLSPEWSHEYDRLKKLELSWDTHRRFVEWCKRENLTPMTSVYSLLYADKLWDAGFRWIKVGSAQAMNSDLINYLVKLGFHVVISTGGYPLSDIPRIHPLAGVLHCVSQYPCPPNEANLSRMLQIPKFFPSTPYGFSSHINPLASDWWRPLFLASHLGATFIEAHFTTKERSETKDGPVSLNYPQLKILCDYDRLEPKDKLNHQPEFGMIKCYQDPEEASVIRKYAGRWKK